MNANPGGVIGGADEFDSCSFEDFLDARQVIFARDRDAFRVFVSNNRS